MNDGIHSRLISFWRLDQDDGVDPFYLEWLRNVYLLINAVNTSIHINTYAQGRKEVAQEEEAWEEVEGDIGPWRSRKWLRHACFFQF